MSNAPIWVIFQNSVTYIYKKLDFFLVLAVYWLGITKPKNVFSICNSCIMGPSDLPDMYTPAQGPQLDPRVWVYHIRPRQIMRECDTTDMYHAG